MRSQGRFGFAGLDSGGGVDPDRRFEGIERGLREAEQGLFASDAEVEAVLSKFRH